MVSRGGWLVLALALSATRSAAATDVVAIVAADSPITTLTQSQVVDIFLGRTRKLPDGDKAVPLDQPEGSATRDEFYTKFTGKSAAQIKAHWSKIVFTGRGQPPAQVPTSQEALKRVAANPRAIAYIERALVDATVRILAP
jgi:ABC-type phosphate transport system substrate-binding protein